MSKILLANLTLLTAILSTEVQAAQKTQIKSTQDLCHRMVQKISGSFQAECQYRRTKFDQYNTSQTSAPLLYSYDDTELTQKNFGEANASTLFFEAKNKSMPVLNIMLAPSLEEQELISDFRITCTDRMIETSFYSKLNPSEKTYQRIRLTADGKLSGLNAVSTPSIIDDLTCILTPAASK